MKPGRIPPATGRAHGAHEPVPTSKDNRPETLDELVIQCAAVGTACISKNGLVDYEKAISWARRLLKSYLDRKEESLCVGKDGVIDSEEAINGAQKIVAEYMGRKEVGIKSFRDGLESLINSESMENGCNTPDFILAAYMSACLMAFDSATNARDSWYGIALSPGHAHDKAEPNV